jgi:hypothetical protein
VICSWCGGRKGFALGHDWNEATCTEAKTCGRCGETEGEALGHDWSGEWTVIKEATATEEGRKETHCVNGCGQKKVITIPVIGATEDQGNFEKDVEIELGTPVTDVTLNNTKEELLEADKIFSDVEKGKIEKGEDARVWIEITKTNESAIKPEDKAEIEKEAAKIMGEDIDITYFEADLFKQVGNGKVVELPEPGIFVKITVAIPESLLQTDESKVREYKILRLHEGEVEVIEGEFNAETGEFTFETDKFSTYAIVYEDVPVEVNDPDENLPEMPGTGDYSGSSYTYELMLFVGLAMVCYALKRKNSFR